MPSTASFPVKAVKTVKGSKSPQSEAAKVAGGKDSMSLGMSVYIHSAYIATIAILLALLCRSTPFNRSILGETKNFTSSSWKFEFEESDPRSSFIDIPPEVLPLSLLRVWKWKSPLTQQQCDSTWKSAEILNKYEEYSKFGSEFPTLDVSLDKLDSDLQPV